MTSPPMPVCTMPLVGAFLVMVFALSACGSGSVHASATSSGQSATTSTSTGSTTLATLPAAQFIRTGTFTNDNGNGYTTSGVFKTGAIVHATQMQVDGFVLGQGCSVNSQDDAVEPFELSVTNTTTGFSYSPEENVSVYFPPDQGSLLRGAYEVGGQAACVTFSGNVGPDDGQNTTIDLTWHNLSPSQSATFGGYLIFPNYYTPAAPDGTPSKIDDLAVVVDGALTGHVTALSGFQSIPGPSSGPKMPASMPLDPNQSTNCAFTGDCPMVTIPPP